MKLRQEKGNEEYPYKCTHGVFIRIRTLDEGKCYLR
nr:MAG TPA: hypothetical protein [Caudoviricetes sp.]